MISECTVLTPVQETSLATPVTTLPLPSVSTIPTASLQQTTTPIPTPPITTDAPTITTAIPKSDALSVVQLRVAKLEKDMFELKNVDHSAATILGDALQKALQKHSEDLIQKHSVKPAPKSSKIKTPTVNIEKGSEKSASEILKIKREQAEKQKTPMFTIKSTDKEALKELYHTLMEALIEDENAMDKGVADTVKDHKRKHDDDEDDDDKDPPAGPNHSKKTNRRTKDSKSSKNPSTTKETPKGKDPSKGSKTDKPASAKEPVKEPTVEVIMDDAGEYVVHDDDQPQDTSEPKTAKTLSPEWLTQPLRPPTPDPEWNKRQYVLNRLKIDNLTQDILVGPAYNLLKGDRYPFDLSKPFPLQGHPGHLTVVADYFFNNDLEYLKSSDPEITYTTSITKTKAAQFEIEGIDDMVPMLWRVKSVSVKKLHGYGHLEEIVVKRADRQLYNDIIDFIVALRMFTKSLVIKKENVVYFWSEIKNYRFTSWCRRVTKVTQITNTLKNFNKIEFKELYTPSHKPLGVIYEDLVKQKRVMRANELYKFSDGTLKKVRDELHHRVLDFNLGYNKEMSRRKWTATEKKRSKLMVELIDKQIRERRIIQNLEILVGARELEMDYKLMTRTV
ncbi:hypothetical protein Tco_1104779 [Tanacetum coccineum]